MSEKNFDPNKAKKDLWMSEKELVEINKEGHEIGLHSFSHPTQMSKLTKNQQEVELMVKRTQRLSPLYKHSASHQNKENR